MIIITIVKSTILQAVQPAVKDIQEGLFCLQYQVPSGSDSWREKKSEGKRPFYSGGDKIYKLHFVPMYDYIYPFMIAVFSIRPNATHKRAGGIRPLGRDEVEDAPTKGRDMIQRKPQGEFPKSDIRANEDSLSLPHIDIVSWPPSLRVHDVDAGMHAAHVLW